MEMSADEYFKRKICRNMGIDLDWLHEKDTDERFRINEIKKVKQSETQSIKAKKIMTEFLAIKKRDNREDKARESKKELEHFVKADIFLKMIKMRSQVLPGIKKVDKNISIKTNRTIITRKVSQSTMNKGNLSQRVKNENMKAISAAAVNLQKDIQEIENSFKASKRNSRSNYRRLNRLKSTGPDGNNKKLVDSILLKAKERKETPGFLNDRKRRSIIDKVYC